MNRENGHRQALVSGKHALTCLRFLSAVPPAKPIIYDAKRRDMSKLLEAYPEGADLFLVCEVHGGKCRRQQFDLRL